ncbi:MAG: ribosome hibernation-promoting factor, HPF/YfiA family [Alphaproteobacteria bacterium]
MHFSISGKQIDIGSSLQEHVKKHLENNVKKFFDHPIAADIAFSKESQYLYRADIMVNEGTGVGTPIKASGQAKDAYTAFDTGLVKIQEQLRRYKKRIKNHHKRKASEIDFEENILKGKKYVISPLPSYTEEENDNVEDNPTIIAEKATNIERLSVSEAVMKMDLANLPALLFTNSTTGRINVVYHRADGNISWVDPENK